MKCLQCGTDMLPKSTPILNKIRLDRWDCPRCGRQVYFEHEPRRRCYAIIVGYALTDTETGRIDHKDHIKKPAQIAAMEAF